MTLYQFNALPYEHQLVHVFDKGTFLTRRWEEEDGINLYHLPDLSTGFFVEVYYDTYANEIVRVRAFSNLSQLEDYAANVRLPDEL
jgi:hypothetical protein